MKRHLIALLVGTALGAVLGWYTPELQRVPVSSLELRQWLALKTALVVGSTAYLVSMYLTIRRRAVQRLTGKGQVKNHR